MDAGTTTMDAGRDAGRLDAGPTPCTSSADCDDGHQCTLDECVVGNVCRHDPLDARCDEGARCVVGRGCVTGSTTRCTTAADCDDGSRCNGPETCIREMCIPGSPLDCDDGNACTVDRCDETAASGCRYEPAPDCDAGVSLVDAGPVCTPFDPAVHYTGRFTFAATPRSGGTGSAVYTVSDVQFTVVGDGLTIQADRFTLTQATRASDGSFDASFSDGCSSVRLQGRFDCAERWEGTWTASFSGSCSICPAQTRTVSGFRL